MGTFSTIENSILGTFIFDYFPTLGAATQVATFFGRIIPKRDPLCAKPVTDARKNEASDTRTYKDSGETLANLPTLGKSATRVAQHRSHFFFEAPKKRRDPLCTGQETGKAANPYISLGAKQVAPFF